MLEEVQATRERVFILKEEKVRIKEEGRYVGWAKNIGNMTWTEVKKLHSDFSKQLHTTPENKDTVKAFLKSQNHSIEQFDNDPATVILEYIAKEITA